MADQLSGDGAPSGKWLDTPGVRVWMERRSRIEALKGLRAGSGMYASLLESGVSQELLDGYLASDRSYKAGSPSEPRGLLVERLTGAGGVISGGHALRKYLFLDPGRDVDVFFNEFPKFVQAVLESRSDPTVDVCLYDSVPYESFDLTPSEVSVSGGGEFSSSDAFDTFSESGRGEIRMDNVFHPVATLRRLVKYGLLYGARFPSEQIAVLAAMWGVRSDVVDRAMEFSY